MVNRSRPDRIFRAVTTAGGLSSLLIMGLIALFLLLKSLPAFGRAGLGFFTVQEWGPDGTRFGIASMLYGTVVIAVIGLVLAVPIGIGAALFVNEIVPRRVRPALTSLIDLLAAVPSLVYGIWGVMYLGPHLVGTSRWIADYLDFVPIFDSKTYTFAGSLFICGVVVGLMVVPIITSIVREVCSQAPLGEREGALALGATRWGVIRTVVLPFSRGGIIGASMLGLGRALGETIAITLIISTSFRISPRILDPGGGTIASLIALYFPEANSRGIEALMAAGLTLFVLTLLVNMIAAGIIARSRAGAGIDL